MMPATARMSTTTVDVVAPSYLNANEASTDLFDEAAFSEYFGLLSNETLVIVRPHGGDDDDRMLEELRPKYVILYDPDPAFVRRMEVGFIFLLFISIKRYSLCNVEIDFKSFPSRSCYSRLLHDVQRFR
jgi:hypothetical protein